MKMIEVITHHGGLRKFYPTSDGGTLTFSVGQSGELYINAIDYSLTARYEKTLQAFAPGVWFEVSFVEPK